MVRLWHAAAACVRAVGLARLCLCLLKTEARLLPLLSNFCRSVPARLLARQRHGTHHPYDAVTEYLSLREGVRHAHH